jgi:methylated-DNA-[protein]-cysteine S-methyltransferase
MNEPTYFTTVASPVGELLLTSDGDALTGILLPRPGRAQAPRPEWLRDDAPFRETREQLDAYFAGDRQTFDLPLRPEGTAFQLQVWRELCNIPYGATISYAELARRVGRPGAARAVGAANGRNPLPIVVPCHRVIGADGTLTGYGGGLECKRRLLEHEAGARNGDVHPSGRGARVNSGKN